MVMVYFHWNIFLETQPFKIPIIALELLGDGGGEGFLTDKLSTPKGAGACFLKILINLLG